MASLINALGELLLLLPLPIAVLTSSLDLTNLFLYMTHLQALCCIIKKEALQWNSDKVTAL